MFTFEPAADNFALLCRHLAPFEARAVVRRAAVFRSDRDVASLPFGPTLDRANTGGFAVWNGPDCGPVPGVAFDAVLDEVTRAGRQRVRLVKLDCEGSEWPILLTSRRLGLIDALCGEYHVDDFRGPLRVEGFGRYRPELLRDVLTAQGFAVELEPTRLPVGLFFARRPGVPGWAPRRRMGGMLAALGRLLATPATP